LTSKICNVNEILDKFGKFYEKDDDEEYENIFNRINIYFNNIINEIKLSYLENTKDIIQREIYNKYRIKVIQKVWNLFKYQELESQLYLIDEKYKKEKENMENKIKELEKLLTKSNENLTEKDEKHKKDLLTKDADIVQLITESLLDKIEFYEKHKKILKEQDSKSLIKVHIIKNY
jgi:hypothetical protein